jgi:hypothetical protein
MGSDWFSTASHWAEKQRLLTIMASAIPVSHMKQRPATGHRRQGRVTGTASVMMPMR